jgi:hypothetical protein
MIAFAAGKDYKQYAKIVMSSTSPETGVSTQEKRDRTTNMGSMELRGLHISTADIILAAFFDTSGSGIFKISTINFATSKISF